ncbi:MAG: radical SAM protein [Oligoflexia bacterium]|nr:radical SAM protein [Oligoflexia bacterium]
MTQFEELFVHPKSLNSEITKRVIEHTGLTPMITDRRPYSSLEGRLTGEEFSKSKKRLYLLPHEGHFFRKCPGTTGAACCNYFVLNLGVHCNMNCSYCYLQGYINSPVTQIYTNIDDAFAELTEMIRENPTAEFRVGTGETIDSLSLDHLTLYSIELISFFAKHRHLICEFKTKTDQVDHFIKTPHSGNVIVSWSVNPQKIVSEEEHGTATLDNRLSAARRCADHGFPVAFHIDPMIYFDEWRIHYEDLVDQICSRFKPNEVKWISVGALRYPPTMKHILRQRLTESKRVLTSELFLGTDGKLRYDHDLRNEMFKSVVKRFSDHSSEYPLLLCMETGASWQTTFEQTPRQIQGVKELFDPIVTTRPAL